MNVHQGSMTGLPIPASAIEAAAKALRVGIGAAAISLLAAERGRETDLSGELAEEMLRAAFDELGMYVDDDDGHNTMYRLVSPWINRE